MRDAKWRRPSSDVRIMHIMHIMHIMCIMRIMGIMRLGEAQIGMPTESLQPASADWAPGGGVE
jgi:hypothetical protein